MMKKTTDELMKELQSKETAEEFLSRNTEEMVAVSIAGCLNDMLAKHGRNKSEVIREAQIEESYGYQIFRGTREKPSRNYLLCLAFAMKLSISETQTLLRIAQLPMLYPRIRRDSLILKAIAGQKNLAECDLMLELFGEQTLIKKV